MAAGIGTGIGASGAGIGADAGASGAGIGAVGAGAATAAAHSPSNAEDCVDRDVDRDGTGGEKGARGLGPIASMDAASCSTARCKTFGTALGGHWMSA